MGLLADAVHFRDSSPCIIQGDILADTAFDYNFEGRSVRIKYLRLTVVEGEGAIPHTFAALYMYDRNGDRVELVSVKSSGSMELPAGCDRTLESHIQCCVSFPRGSYMYLGNAGDSRVSYLVIYEPLE